MEQFSDIDRKTASENEKTLCKYLSASSCPVTVSAAIKGMQENHNFT